MKDAKICILYELLTKSSESRRAVWISEFNMLTCWFILNCIDIDWIKAIKILRWILG